MDRYYYWKEKEQEVGECEYESVAEDVHRNWVTEDLWRFPNKFKVHLLLLGVS